MGLIGRITNRVKNVFSEAGETGFANAGATAYVVAEAGIREDNDDRPSVAIDDERKALLRPDFGDIVDDVLIVYGAELVELVILGQRIGTNADAQTFGTRLYFEGPYVAGDADQLKLLAHELIHTQQYRDARRSSWEFGKRYFREYYRAGFSYDDNEMEKEADEFAACFILRAGSLVSVERRFRGTRAGGWTSLVPFRRDNATFVQAYNQDSGAAQILQVQPGGNAVEQVWQGQWSRGWTSFMPFVLGGVPHCLSYKAGNGKVDIYSFNPGGNGYTAVSNAEWTENWTSIMPFVLNGQPHYLAYKSGNGRVSIGKIGPGGVINSLWTDVWSEGWTSFLPFTRDEAPHFLAYKAEGGRVAIDQINVGGAGVAVLREMDWGDDWTTLLPLSDDGREFLTYRGGSWQKVLNRSAWIPGDGHAHVARIEANNETRTRWCDQWKGSWRCATSFRLDDGYYTLFYGADGNQISISKVRV